jgi:hypothetical protein
MLNVHADRVCILTCIHPSAALQEQTQLSGVLPRSDDTGEVGEDCCELMPLADIHAEFVVAAMEVLGERVHGMSTDAELNRFRTGMGRSRAFRRP